MSTQKKFKQTFDESPTLYDVHILQHQKTDLARDS